MKTKVLHYIPANKVEKKKDTYEKCYHIHA